MEISENTEESALAVSRAVWDWRPDGVIDASAEPVWPRLSRMLVIMGAFAGLALWRGHSTVVWVLGGYALANLLAALLWPPVFRAHARFWEKLGRGGAAVIGAVLLTVVYLLVFTPAAIVLKVLGRDPLRRHFPGREETYWRPVAGRGESDRYYRRQF